MTTMTRTDEHRPSAIRPEDYDYVISYDTQPPIFTPPLGVVTPEVQAMAAAIHERWFEQFEQQVLNPLRASEATVYGSPNKCDHCGANLRYGNLWRHRPTGGVIVTGNICAEETMSVPDRARLEQKRLREAAASARMREADSKYAREQREVAERRYPEAVAILNAALTEIASVRAHNEQIPPGNPNEREIEINYIVHDIAERFGRKGYLSEKQAALVLRLTQQEQERDERKARESEQVASGEIELCPTGKITVTGTVCSAYRKDTAYGSRHVMTVRDDRGFKVWGSVPQHLNPNNGDKIRFNASVERSDRDDTFGFFKRPTKATILPPAPIAGSGETYGPDNA